MDDVKRTRSLIEERNEDEGYRNGRGRVREIKINLKGRGGDVYDSNGRAKDDDDVVVGRSSSTNIENEADEWRGFGI